MISRVGSQFGFVCGALPLMWCLLCGISTAQEPEVLVELGRNRIFEGESVPYLVTLNNCGNAGEPVFAKNSDVQLRQTSVATVHQSSFDGFKRVTINGRRYEYVLTPQRGGSIKIPGPTVEVDGKTYRGETVTLEVSGPNAQDLAVLEISANHTSVYPLQPFTVRLTVALKALPDPYTTDDPLRGAGDIPVLSIPWADDKSLPEGVEPDSPVERWLTSLLAPARRAVAGFGINNYRLGREDLFSLFAEQKRAMFRPEPRQVKRKDGQGRTTDYWEYTFERKLTASKIGSLTFGPATLKGSFAKRLNSLNGVDVEDVYAVAKGLTVEVRDVPATGRPASYIGAIGRLDADVDLTPTTVKVGDPMTLSVRVHGQGTLANAFAPKLQEMPEIADKFKIYEATTESGEGERRFTYSLRPKKAGLTEFPPIELAYFDYDNEKYVTIKTSPIKIDVAESDHVGDQDIAMSSKAVASSPAVEAAGGGVFANVTDVRQVYDERVQPDLWFLLLGGMAGSFVLCSFVARGIRRRRNDPQLQRRRSASKRARSALADARRYSAAGSRRETADSLRAAITGLIADAIDGSEASLTSRDAAHQLSTIGVGEELCNRCQILLDEFDAARYGGGVHSLDDQVQSADELLTDLLRELRQRKLAL